jgi:hypothetical protein
MPLMSLGSSYTTIQKVPAYAVGFYAFNTACLALGLLDSLLIPLFGTSEDMVGTMTSDPIHYMFFFVSLLQTSSAFLVYPYEFLPKEAVKGQQLIYAILIVTFYPLLYLFFAKGMIGIPGLAQYGLMNTVLAGIAFNNYSKLK